MPTYNIRYRESHMHTHKGKSTKRTQRRTKRVSLPGKLQSWSRGTFATRFGTRVHGVKLTYIKPIPKGTGRDGNIKKMRITKVVHIPERAVGVSVSKR